MPVLNWSFVSSANPQVEGMSFPLAEFSYISWIPSLSPQANKYFIFFLVVVRKKGEKNQLMLLAGALCILIPDYERTSECPYDILHKGSVFMALLREPKIAFSKQWHTEGLGTKSTSVCNSEQCGTYKVWWEACETKLGQTLLLFLMCFMWILNLFLQSLLNLKTHR